MLALSGPLWFGLGIIGIIIWVAMSLFFFPLALIMAYVVRDRRAYR